MVTCAVIDCNVNHRNNPQNYTFHRFPLDPLIRTKWLQLIGRVGWTPTKHSTICGKHFLDQYKRKSNTNTTLRKDAVPTLFVPGRIKVTAVSSYLKRISPPPPPPPPEPQPQTTINRLIVRIQRLKENLEEKQNTIRNLTSQNKRQQLKIIKLSKIIKELHFVFLQSQGYSEPLVELEECLTED